MLFRIQSHARHENRPAKAHDRLLVPDGDVPERQLLQQLAVFNQLIDHFTKRLPKILWLFSKGFHIWWGVGFGWHRFGYILLKSIHEIFLFQWQKLSRIVSCKVEYFKSSNLRLWYCFSRLFPLIALSLIILSALLTASYSRQIKK